MIKDRRRSEFEILVDILSLAKEKVNKTKILYQANLSYTQLSDYLDFLLDKELLLVSEKPKRKYGITEKGLEFLSASEEILDILEGDYKEKEGYNFKGNLLDDTIVKDGV